VPLFYFGITMSALIWLDRRSRKPRRLLTPVEMEAREAAEIEMDLRPWWDMPWYE
jgi:hypothetical protein